MDPVAVLTAHGMTNAGAVVTAAQRAGVPLWVAAAVIQKESNGRNVYGNDKGGVYSTGDPERPNPNVVTRDNFARFEARVLAGETSNGVGPAQITWPGFIKDAKARGIDLSDPAQNIRYGMDLIAQYLGGKTTAEAIQYAGRRYNGAAAYGVDLAAKAATWAARLTETQEEPVGVSSLGWHSVSSPGARRVGPHVPHPTNPREIGFRNHATADLMAAAMWLIRTGNGGKRPDVVVRQWHGIRPTGAAFGSTNSDHHAGVAMDVNWDAPHPWERATGVAVYDAHMADARFAVQHALFADVEARLTVPGHRPVVRWCGRSWPTGMGWTAYARGHRDCMHWVIGTTDWGRINAAADHLRTWFRPPRDVADVKVLQKRLGLDQDGDWNAGSIRAMRAEQKRLGVPQTGLPGDVATRKAWEKEDAPKPAPVDPWSLVDTAYVRDVQELLAEATDSAGRVYYTDAVDGSPGKNTRSAVARFQDDHGLTVDSMAGVRTLAALRALVAAQRTEKEAQAQAALLNRYRVAGVNAEDTTALANAWQAPDGPGVLIAARDTPDHHAALAIRDQRPADISVLIVKDGGNLSNATRDEIARVNPDWVYAVGGSTVVPDLTLLAAMTAADVTLQGEPA